MGIFPVTSVGLRYLWVSFESKKDLAETMKYFKKNGTMVYPDFLKNLFTSNWNKKEIGFFPDVAYYNEVAERLPKRSFKNGIRLPTRILKELKKEIEAMPDVLEARIEASKLDVYSFGSGLTASGEDEYRFCKIA